MAEPTSPIIQDLTKQPLSAKVDTSQAKDSDGYYYKAGDFVEISADQTVKKLTTGGESVGVLLTSIHEKQAPDGLDTIHRVAVATKHKYLIKATAEGALAANDLTTAGTTTAGTHKKLNAPTVPVDDPRDVSGRVWKGAADGAEAQILI